MVAKTKEIVASIFKTNVIEFVDVLIEHFEDEPKLVVGRILAASQDPIHITERFIDAVLPYRDYIQSRDSTFFDEINFGFFDDDTLHNIWKSDTMTEDDRETVWSWFSVFIILCDKYQNL